MPALGPFGCIAPAELGVEAHAPSHGARSAREPPNDQTLRQQAAARVRHHPLGQRDLAPARRPRRLEDGRAVEVSPARLDHVVNLDGEDAAAIPADQPPEQRRRVEPREAQPVDRPARGDERSGARVADQSIVADVHTCRVPEERAFEAGTPNSCTSWGRSRSSSGSQSWCPRTRDLAILLAALTLNRLAVAFGATTVV